MSTNIIQQTKLQIALAYAKNGFAVFPLCQNSKSPLKNSRSFHEATTDDKIITQWWEKNPNYNIGIATGEVSDIWVLDIDTNDGKKGDESLQMIEEENSPLPPTLMCKTANGGKHLYFKNPGKKIKNSTSKIAPNIDVRGDGGYIVAPASNLYKKKYKWINEGTDISEAPEWLITKLEDTKKKHPKKKAKNRQQKITLKQFKIF